MSLEIFTTTELLTSYCISVADINLDKVTNLNKVTNFHSSRSHQCAKCYPLFYFNILTVYSEKNFTAINLGCDLSEENTVFCKWSCLVAYRGVYSYHWAEPNT